MPNYPSRLDILYEISQTRNSGWLGSHLITYDDVDTLKSWKRNLYDRQWSELNVAQKYERLLALLLMLNLRSDSDQMDLGIKLSGPAHYDPAGKVIWLGNKPSIITALHELGHYFFGSSELKACVYSVAMFSEAFPKEYASLKWDGHMMKRLT